MKLDLHTHYYPGAYFDMIDSHSDEFEFGKDPEGMDVIRYRGARFFGITPPMTDPEQRIRDMDRVGIDVEVVSLSTPNVSFAEPAEQPKVARYVNDAYVELINAYPERFKAFASMPLDAPDEALKELHRAIDDLGFSGVVLMSNWRGAPLTDERFRPFFDEADRMGVCIFIHPMLPADPSPYREYVLGPLLAFPFDTTLAAARLCFSGMLEQLPNIRWLLGHGGGALPYLFERLDNGYRDLAECRENIKEPPSTYLKWLYYDTVTFNPTTLDMMRNLVGTDHMVMGSDYPHKLGSIERAVSTIEDWAIPDQEKEAVFRGTALSILNNV